MKKIVHSTNTCSNFKLAQRLYVIESSKLRHKEKSKICVYLEIGRGTEGGGSGSCLVYIGLCLCLCLYLHLDWCIILYFDEFDFSFRKIECDDIQILVRVIQKVL